MHSLGMAVTLPRARPYRETFIELRAMHSRLGELLAIFEGDALLDPPPQPDECLPHWTRDQTPKNRLLLDPEEQALQGSMERNGTAVEVEHASTPFGLRDRGARRYTYSG